MTEGYLPYRGRSAIVKTEATHQPKSKHRLVTSKVAIAEVSRSHSNQALDSQMKDRTSLVFNGQRSAAMLWVVSQS
ncbi:MAG: hypothetical protein R3E32_28320 [Chitinophagales bacterium]